MTNQVNILRVKFANELSPNEIPLFRGAVIHAMNDANVLFHNHLEEDRLRYAYPLIQYKRIGGKAAMVCVGEGTEAIGEFFAGCNFDVCFGDKEVTLEVESVKAERCLVQLWDTMFTYRIRKWLPLNQENHEKYLAMESLADKFAMLERMLTGNILSFAKGVDIHFEKQVECKITAIEEPRFVTYKGVKMMAFDAEFKSNVSLPDFVGLGKGVSLGMGTVVKKKEEEK